MNARAAPFTLSRDPASLIFIVILVTASLASQPPSANDILQTGAEKSVTDFSLWRFSSLGRFEVKLVAMNQLKCLSLEA